MEPRCPLCGRPLEVLLERRGSYVCLCPEHGRFYVCRECGYVTRSRRGIAGHAKAHRSRYREASRGTGAVSSGIEVASSGSGGLDVEGLARGLAEGRVGLRELESLSDRQLLLLIAALLARLLRSRAGWEPAPVEPGPAELPEFVRGNPWLQVLRGRGGEA